MSKRTRTLEAKAEFLDRIIEAYKGKVGPVPQTGGKIDKEGLASDIGQLFEQGINYRSIVDTPGVIENSLPGSNEVDKIKTYLEDAMQIKRSYSSVEKGIESFVESAEVEIRELSENNGNKDYLSKTRTALWNLSDMIEADGKNMKKSDYDNKIEEISRYVKNSISMISRVIKGYKAGTEDLLDKLSAAYNYIESAETFLSGIGAQVDSKEANKLIYEKTLMYIDAKNEEARKMIKLFVGRIPKNSKANEEEKAFLISKMDKIKQTYFEVRRYLPGLFSDTNYNIGKAMDEEYKMVERVIPRQ